MRKPTLLGLILLLGCCGREPADPILTADEREEPTVVTRPKPDVAEEGVRLLRESEDLAAAVLSLRKVITSKPINFSYDILEDGSVAGCHLQDIVGQDSRTPQIPHHLVDEVCRSLSQRRYQPPGVRVKTVINIGTPLLR